MTTKPPRKTLTQVALRRERVKQSLLTKSSSITELATEEGVSIAIISHDIRSIREAGILEEAQEKTALAYLGYSGEVDWAVREAKRLHEEEIDVDEGTGEECGGRLDCLTFVAARRKEEIEVAQKLGLLEVAAEKHQVTHKVDMDLEDSKLIKRFGDWIACQSD
jgi:DNA-binding transcriptional ArsR family regulator